MHSKILYRNEIDDVNDIFPKLSAYLQLASNSALKGAPKANKTPPLLDIKQSPPSSPSDVTAKMLLTSALATTNSSSTITTTSTSTATTSTSASAPTTNKISLVPTNILMKPNTSQANGGQAQFSFKPHQFLCAKSAAGTTTAYTTTNGGMPMKVLFVNTLQKPPATSTSGGTVNVNVSASGAITSQSMTNSITTRPMVSIQPKTANITGNQIIQSTYRTRSTTAATATAQGIKAPTVFSTNKYLCSNSAPQPDTSTKRPLSFKSKTSPGFRTLLNQLVQMQSKQLEVSRQRLDLERERLEFEKTTADRILTAMTSLLTARNGTGGAIGNDGDTKDEK